ncbi:hypothetical protein BDQ17DRAFT_1377498, partial [Cyathus striatus]
MSQRTLSKSRATLNTLSFRASPTFTTATRFPRTRTTAQITLSFTAEPQARARALHTTSSLTNATSPPITISSLFYRALYRTNGARRSIRRGAAITGLTLFSISMAYEATSWLAELECIHNAAEIVCDLQLRLRLFPLDTTFTPEELLEHISIILGILKRIEDERDRIKNQNWIKKAILSYKNPQLAALYSEMSKPGDHPSNRDSLISKFEQEFKTYPKRWREIIDSKITVKEFVTAGSNFQEMIASTPKDAAKLLLYLQFGELLIMINENAQAGNSPIYTMIKLSNYELAMTDTLFDVASTIDAGDGDSGVQEGGEV